MLTHINMIVHPRVQTYNTVPFDDDIYAKIFNLSDIFVTLQKGIDFSSLIFYKVTQHITLFILKYI